jgi:hypothetical protein
MTSWGAILGEAALGLDLAKADVVSAGPGRRSTLLDRLDPFGENGRDALFLQEALEFRARGRDAPGGVVRLGARWIHWAYRATIVLVLVAVTSLWLIHTDESSSGPAVVDGRTGTVAALLPAVVGPDLASSRGLTVTLPGGRSVQVSDLHAQLADNTAIRQAGLVPLSQTAILVTGRVNPGASGSDLRTQVSVVLRSESLAEVLARQFDAMLGNGTTP